MSVYRFTEVAKTNRARQWAEKQKLTDEDWPSQWDWLLKEYKNLRDEIKIAYKKPEYIDPRSAKPVPKTTNQYYGWLVDKPDFAFNKYGPDVPTPAPLPEIYKLDLRCSKI